MELFAVKGKFSGEAGADYILNGGVGVVSQRHRAGQSGIG